ncbi:hypothetical protein FHS15_001080 [Paenibacillus castaneae]|uniref:SPOR domain-containing protein n=1 Tax=Paenibacillus castaneae TaxID=474957 RepID=UPI00141B2F5E|nr:SPOR domain-containing protein [Paenibacillus castaneae]NIK75973.1 hypothetical protein [Paenibacillus castaneae]
MNHKNRITYRFDRNGQSINEDKRSSEKKQETTINTSDKQANDSHIEAKQNVIPLYPAKEQNSSNEMSPWHSSFQEDIGALEQLIRNSDMKPLRSEQAPVNKAASSSNAPKRIIPLTSAEEHESLQQFANQEQPEHMHAYEDELVYDNELLLNRMQSTRRIRSSKGPSWFNVFLSVAGALATGALFGYLLLSLFTGATIFPSGSGSKVQPDSQPAIGSSITGDETNANTSNGESGALPSGSASNSQTVSLTGLEQSYFMLQFGVFSNAEGRDTALAQLADKGLASAALTSASDFRVYAGVATNRSKAQAIKALLPDLDLYIKEVTIPSPSKLPYDGTAESAQTFFEQARELVRMLDELTLAQLEQPALSPLSDTAATSWQAEHQKWTESAAAIRIGMKEANGKANLDKLIQSIDTAAKSMLEYDKNPSRAHLWTTQSKLMEAIVNQKKWFESISAL